MFKKNLIKSLPAIILSSLLVITVIYAWQEPLAAPPGGNLPPPLHQGSAIQTKTGGLNLMGNVGIGTTGPTTRLDVDGVVRIRGGSPAAGRVLTSTADGTASWAVPTGGLPTGISGQTLRHDGTSWVANSNIFNTGGNVGIGTASPIDRLHVSNAGDVRVVLRPDSGTNNRESLIDFWSTFDTHIDTGTRRAGRIQVGFNGGVWGTEYMIFGVAGAGDVANPPTERMRIAGTGNVGIGTTAPGQRLQIGVAGDGTSAVANAWNLFSDIRLKNNIVPLTNVLSKLNNINPVKFNWKNDDNKENQIGFIAQEIEEVFPTLVSTDNDGYKSVDYSKFSAVLVSAIKELKVENEQLKSRIEVLENR